MRYIILIVVFVALASLYKSCASPEPEKRPKKQALMTGIHGSLGAEEFVRAEEKNNAKKVCQDIVDIASTSAIDRDQKQKGRPAKIVIDEGFALTNLGADEAAKLRKFYLASYCSAGRNLYVNEIEPEQEFEIKNLSFCSRISPSDKKTPLNVLTEDWGAASPDRKLLYAKNLLVMYKIGPVLHGRSSSDDLTALRKQAEALALEAALNGANGSLDFLVEQYSLGGFGKIDLGKAYLYSRLSDLISRSQNSSRTMYIYKNALRSDVEQVDKQLDACLPLKSPDNDSLEILRNPFQTDS